MPARLLVPLIVALAGFQSHWLDDIWTGASDTAGMAVSAVGSALLLIGWWRWRSRLGIATLTLGLVTVGLVSVADLVGLHTDGSLAPSLRDHWRSDLGMRTATVVAVTLAAVVLALAALARTQHQARNV